MQFTELPVPTSGIINYIFHFADIHIRAGIESGDSKVTRYQEYIDILNKACSYIQSTHGNVQDYVFVVAGDLVHDNRKAGAHCIDLFYQVIKKMAHLAPVYIIRGNHDYNQSSVSEQDMLSALLKGLDQYPNIAYLKQSGYYTAANIGFGLIAIQDALKSGDTHGRVDELPPFPKASALPNNLKKIALFHGDVPAAYPIEWFGDGYDYILLGDLHRLQVYNAKPSSELLQMTHEQGICHMSTYTRTEKHKPIWAYPGSTIQQNFGESIVGHGFLKWDIAHDSVHAFHIPNQYGFITAKQDQDQWHVNMSYPSNDKINDYWVPLQIAAQKQWFPKTIQLRVKQHTHATLSTFEVTEYFANYGFNITNTKSQTSFDTHSDEIDSKDLEIGIDLREFNEPQAWCDYIAHSVPPSDILYTPWKDWILQPTTLTISGVPPEHIVTMNIMSDIQERNKKIQSALDSYKLASESVNTAINTHTKFSLEYIDWAYILCYKDKCHFNFKELNGSVHCIGGKNGHGKTSFLETICIALYGEGFPSRTNKSYSASIICMQRPSRSRAFTSIVFSIDDTTFRIKRTFEANNEVKLNSKDIVLETYNNDNGLFDLIHSGKKATNEWVEKHLGNVHAFLTSCMITQSFDEDFFSKKPTDQKTYLDDQLHLGSSASFQNVLKTASLAYEDISKKLAGILELKKYEVERHRVDHNELEKAIHEHETLKHKIAELQTLYEQNKSQWSSVSEQELLKGSITLQKQLDRLKNDIQAIDLPDNMTLENAWKDNASIKTKLEHVQTYHKQGISIESLQKQHNLHTKHKPEQPDKDKNVVQERIKSLASEIDTIKNGPKLADIVKEQHTKLKKIDKQLQLKNTQLPQLQASAIELEATQHSLVDKKVSLVKPEQYDPDFESKQQEVLTSIMQFQKKHISLQNLQKRINKCVTPSIPESSWNNVTLEREQKRLAVWLGNLNKETGITNTLEIKKHMQDTQSQSKDVETLLSDKVAKQQSLAITKEELQTLYDRLQQVALDVVKQQPPPSTYQTKVKKNNERKKYETLVQQLDVHSKLVEGCDEIKLRAIKDQYPVIKVRIEHLDENIASTEELIDSCEKHDFNQKCKACMSHPWKLQLDKHLKHLESQKQERAKLDLDMLEQFGMIITNIAQEQQALQKLKLIDEVNKMRSEVDTLTQFWLTHDSMEAAYEQWKQACCQAESDAQKAKDKLNKLIKDLDLLKSDVDKLSKSHTTFSTKAAKLEFFYNEWTSVYEQLSHDIKNNRTSLEAWKKWRDLHQVLESDQETWTKLEQHLPYFEKQSQLKESMLRYSKNIQDIDAQLAQIAQSLKKTKQELQQCEQDIRALEHQKQDMTSLLKDLEINKVSYDDKTQKHAMWINILQNFTVWETWQDKLKDIELSMEAHNLHQALQDNAKIIDKIALRNRLHNELLKYENTLYVMPFYTKSKELEANIKKTETHKLELELHIRDAQTKFTKYEQMQKDLQSLDEHTQRLHMMHVTLKNITSHFATFKDWVLEKQILPVICKNINQLLTIMCKNHRVIELSCTFDDKNNFNWMMKDGIHTPPLEKASGFQRFTISLAMRIVLGRLGVAGIKNRQLFIDEGFTACDVDNLDNVPRVLHKLLEMYDAIVLVSHLDDLKNGIDSFINIDRDELKGLSSIQYGAVQESYTTVKKVGRPKVPKLC